LEPQSPQTTPRRHCTAGILSRVPREGILPPPRARRPQDCPAMAGRRYIDDNTQLPWESWARCPCHGRRRRSPSHSPLCASALPLSSLFPSPPWRGIRPRLRPYSASSLKTSGDKPAPFERRDGDTGFREEVAIPFYSDEASVSLFSFNSLRFHTAKSHFG